MDFFKKFILNHAFLSIKLNQIQFYEIISFKKIQKVFPNKALWTLCKVLYDKSIYLMLRMTLILC